MVFTNISGFHGFVELRETSKHGGTGAWSRRSWSSCVEPARENSQQWGDSRSVAPRQCVLQRGLLRPHGPHCLDSIPRHRPTQRRNAGGTNTCVLFESPQHEHCVVCRSSAAVTSKAWWRVTPAATLVTGTSWWRMTTSRKSWVWAAPMTSSLVTFHMEAFCSSTISLCIAGLSKPSQTLLHFLYCKRNLVVVYWQSDEQVERRALECRPSLAVSAREVGLLRHRRGNPLPFERQPQPQTWLEQVSVGQPQRCVATAVQSAGEWVFTFFLSSFVNNLITFMADRAMVRWRTKVKKWQVLAAIASNSTRQWRDRGLVAGRLLTTTNTRRPSGRWPDKHLLLPPITQNRKLPSETWFLTISQKHNKGAIFVII